MNGPLQPLLDLLNRLPDEFRDIRLEVESAVRVLELAPSLAVVAPRKVLDLIIRDVYQRCVNEPAATRPLEGLTQQLVKKGHFPTELEGYASLIRQHGNVGAHRAGVALTPTIAQDCLRALVPLLEWYVALRAPGPNPLVDPPARPTTHARPVSRMAIVPKGLRAFDAGDADFFLDLLPGPRDGGGLPESIRFWKRRIEEPDEQGFGVGVIYGPSGCGKTSLVKAGLVPQLAHHVVCVYIEATADETENRLLRGLHKKFLRLAKDRGLPETLLALRQGEGLKPDQKVVVIIDQFEQWLHARPAEAQAALAQALRQCDGERLQCLILVRDDFWMPLTRFAALLDIELVQGQNLAAVDLFDLAHARQVLIAFGRAFGQIGAELTGENEWFLDEAVQALAQDGRIISIRLAIFAEMMKHRKWTPATWQAVGGLAGVGLTFLEETVGAAIASPRMRRHRTAILATLRELLPPLGTRIRGGMKSYEHLLEKSGYADRPKEFDEVLKLLSTELRLITPTEPAGAEEGAEQPGSARYYQLIHDYLVLALQQWLVRKQGETPRGRAELRLELCTGAWETSKHDVRMLPSFWEWLSILQLTKWRLWTEPQRHLMRAANWHHGLRGAAVFGIIVLVAGLALGGWELHQSRQQSLRVDDMVQQLLDADSSQVVEIAHELQRVRPQSEPLLRKALAEAEQAEGNATTDAERTKEARYRLHASLALALYDRTQLTYLYNQLLAANAQDFGMIRDSLSTYKAELVGRLWEVATAPPVKEQEQRLRAASALATYAPDVDGWSKVGGPVAEQLLAVGPDSLGLWMEALRPVRDKLLAPLKTVFRAQAEDRTSAYIAAGILADYAADKPDDLIDLMLDADEKQFVVLSPKLKGDPERVASGMEAALGQQAGENASDDQKDRLAKRRANAAAMLLKLGRPTQVWQFLVHRPDGRERAYLIHRLAPLGIEPAVLTGRLFPGNGVQPVVGPALAPPASRAERLVFDPDKSVARALILSLGEFGPSQLSPSDQESLLPRLLQLYQGDPDPGLHGACEWLLRKWQQGPQLEAIDQKLATGKIEGQRGWYVNGQQQTLVVVPGPSDVEMGSPPTEIGREEDAERPKKKTIDRSFAIATKEVTVKQFLLFNAQKNYNRQFARTPDCPVDNVIWYEAAAYCNWLSEQENIPQGQWCYLANADRKYAEGMKTAPNYLTLQGYRLPTEAEWELACRAGSRTSRYYGESADLLGYYAWYTKNSRDQEMLPVGTLRPNDLGLFDMLGNVMEWTMGEVANSAALANEKDGDDVESPDDADAIKDTARVSRGGSFLSYTLNVRAAFRNWIKPSFASKVIGFRPARTIH